MNCPVVWYVVARRDNDYPVLVYADKEQAHMASKINGYKVVPVIQVTKKEDNETY